MRNNLSLLESMLNRFGMELNTEKTEYMTQLTGELWYSGKNLKKVNSYKYLGKIIQNDLQHDEHLSKQLEKAEQINLKLVPFMLKGKGISPSMARNLIIGAM